jgi:hypothetical protein
MLARPQPGAVWQMGGWGRYRAARHVTGTPLPDRRIFRLIVPGIFDLAEWARSALT